MKQFGKFLGPSNASYFDSTIDIHIILFVKYNL